MDHNFRFLWIQSLAQRLAPGNTANVMVVGSVCKEVLKFKNSHEAAHRNPLVTKSNRNGSDVH